MTEAAFKHLVKSTFARMPERRVPEVMPQSNSFGQILIEPQGACNRPRNLRNF